MKKQNTGRAEESTVTWNNLEQWIRGHVQGFIQRVLEDEVTEWLGRQKSVRRKGVETLAGYRNGYGRSRRLTVSCGTITVKRPRVRDCEERFVSRVLPLFKRKSMVVDHVLPELYLHGLAQGDFELALQGLLGTEAPLSGSTIARLKEKWQGEWAQWQSRSLEEIEPVYLWVDGIYVKAGLEKDKAALLVVLAALSTGQKVVLAVVPGHRESTASWGAVLRDLKARGLRAPRLVMGDGHLGIWAGLRDVYPEAEEQRCWNHKILNVLDKLPTRQQAAAKPLLCQIPYAPTQREAERRQAQFVRWCEQRGYPEAAHCLQRDWERLVTFYRFPQPHWQHLRTTNPVESPFAAVRLRTNAAKRFKKVANATAILWKMLMVAEQTFRRVKHPELMAEVYGGVKFIDGRQEKTEVAA
ncbi:MAG: IS256 family transposase [Nitrospirota bacterium]|nr:IS256 family transposase [Nitrospirota bacterium]